MTASPAGHGITYVGEFSQAQALAPRLLCFVLSFSLVTIHSYQIQLG